MINNRTLVNPPVGMAHIIADILDLFTIRKRNAIQITLHCAIQPNSSPHLGTILTMMTAFAFADRISNIQDLPCDVSIDFLENSPFKKVVLGCKNKEYSKSFDSSDGAPALQNTVKEYDKLLSLITNYSRVNYKKSYYKDLQNNSNFRSNLLRVLNNRNDFEELISPSDNKLRVRFPCPTCGLTDKSISSTSIENISEDKAIFSSICPLHGSHKAVLSATSSDYFDTNSSLRSILKASVLTDDYINNKHLHILVNGADWSGMWLQRIYVESLYKLGYTPDVIPLHLFAPLIVDWSGAKLSKSVYVTSQEYSYLPKGLVDFYYFEKDFGSQGIQILWKEVKQWVSNPSKLFRSYSAEYIMNLLGGDNEI